MKNSCVWLLPLAFNIFAQISCDVSKEDDWQDLWSHTETAFGGKVSLLVNNAGVSPQHGWKTCINIMLTGVGYGTFLAIEKMGTSKVILIFCNQTIYDLTFLRIPPLHHLTDIVVRFQKKILSL